MQTRLYITADIKTTSNNSMRNQSRNMNAELMMDRMKIIICREEDDLMKYTSAHMTIMSKSMIEEDSRDACYYYVITMSVHDSVQAEREVFWSSRRVSSVVEYVES